MIAGSWNVNSLRVRLPQVLQWLDSSGCDVLMLQETKLTDENFPVDAFEETGWRAIYRGQKTYNGVAIVSRLPVIEMKPELPDILDREKRICMALLDDLLLVDVYVPNGSEVGSDKYRFKLQWLETFTELISTLLAEYPKMIVAGDFNITPADVDVHDPQAWHESILCSSEERQALARLMDLGFDDSFRLQNDQQGQFSWWDYRAAAFRRNRGLRIDLILTSHALRGQINDVAIDRTPRGWERPSDHAPVSVTLA